MVKVSAMALYRYCARSSLSSSLPSPNDIDIELEATQMANTAIRSVLEDTERNIQSSGHKCKVYKTFKPKQRVMIGKYTVENGNAAAVKIFKAKFDGEIGESTVRLFKQKYLSELKKVKQVAVPGELLEVRKALSQEKGAVH